MTWHAVDELREHGIDIPAPDGVLVSDEIPLERISRSRVTIHPGVRVTGPDSVIADGVELGAAGPVVLDDVTLGRDASVASGALTACTLLEGAAVGPNAHVRDGTLLEEHASTGHAVGLKQTVLMSFVTLGSLINFCDCLLAGGRSRHDHSEVGSGFIHFNFTPFGPRGDKVTASLFGDVPSGVLLRSDRIFLGGAAGVVGPVSIGFGTVLAAGSVYRRDQRSGRLVYGETPPSKAVVFDASRIPGAARRLRASRRYVAQLRALRAWYRHIRLPAARDDLEREVLASAARRLEAGVAERVRQSDRMVEGSGDAALIEDWAHDRDRLAAFGTAAEDAPPPALLAASPRDHLEWIGSLDDGAAAAAREWLQGIVDGVAGVDATFSTPCR